jgi:plasmid stabilization system protein ParE
MVKRKIIWSQFAKSRLIEILEFYTIRNRSNSYSKRIYTRFKVELNYLTSYPEIGIKTELEGVRGLIIEDFILYYEITETRIIIHTVWDCRQNPENNKII